MFHWAIRTWPHLDFLGRGSNEHKAKRGPVKYDLIAVVLLPKIAITYNIVLFVEGILMIILMQMNQMCWIFFCIYYHIFNSVVPMCSIYFYQFLRGCEHPFIIYQLAFQGYHFDPCFLGSSRRRVFGATNQTASHGSFMTIDPTGAGMIVEWYSKYLVGGLEMFGTFGWCLTIYWE